MGSALLPRPAGAAVTLGQLAPGTPTNCAPNNDWAQATVNSGNSYVVPGTGRIISWSNISSSTATQTMSFKIWRQIAGLEYQVVGHDGPRMLTPSALNTFPADIPVKPGDILGLHTVTTDDGCLFDVPSGSVLDAFGDAPDGGSTTFIELGTTYRLNVTAVFVPSNTFTLGPVARNKKKGTATLNVGVPNSGELTGSGKGAKVAAGATISKAVTAGTAQLLVKAKGKKKRKLNRAGKVKLNIAITYIPTGGDPSTQSLKVKLKKKL
jgi:hypothetical protein